MSKLVALGSAGGDLFRPEIAQWITGSTGSTAHSVSRHATMNPPAKVQETGEAALSLLPNLAMQNAIAELLIIQQGMKPSQKDDGVELVREARSGAMYGEQSD